MGALETARSIQSCENIPIFQDMEPTNSGMGDWIGVPKSTRVSSVEWTARIGHQEQRDDTGDFIEGAEKRN
jgi:hypothetical protein